MGDGWKLVMVMMLRIHAMLVVIVVDVLVGGHIVCRGCNGCFYR